MSEGTASRPLTRTQAAFETLDHHISRRLKKGNLEYLEGFKDKHVFVYYGYAVPDCAFDATAKHISKRKSQTMEGATGTILQRVRGLCKKKVPNNYVEILRTFIPQSLATEPGFGTKRTKLCDVYTIVRARHVENSYIDFAESEAVFNILNKTFCHSKWRVGQARWFIGGMDYVEDYEWDDPVVRQAQQALDIVTEESRHKIVDIIAEFEASKQAGSDS